MIRIALEALRDVAATSLIFCGMVAASWLLCRLAARLWRRLRP